MECPGIERLVRSLCSGQDELEAITALEYGHTTIPLGLDVHETEGRSEETRGQRHVRHREIEVIELHCFLRKLSDPDRVAMRYLSICFATRTSPQARHCAGIRRGFSCIAWSRALLTRGVGLT